MACVGLSRAHATIKEAHPLAELSIEVLQGIVWALCATSADRLDQLGDHVADPPDVVESKDRSVRNAINARVNRQKHKLYVDALEQPTTTVELMDLRLVCCVLK